MSITSLEIPIDFSEAAEAAEVISRWAGRKEELPAFLREEIERIASEDSSVAILEAITERPGVSVVASPELRALLANLRAREGA